MCRIRRSRIGNWDRRRSSRLRDLRSAMRSSRGICNRTELDISLGSADWTTVHATGNICAYRNGTFPAMIGGTTIYCRAAMRNSRCGDHRYSWRNRWLAVHRRDRRRFSMVLLYRRRRTSNSHGGRGSRGARRDRWRRDCLLRSRSVGWGRLRRAGGTRGLAWDLCLLRYGSHMVNCSKVTSCVVGESLYDVSRREEGVD